MKDPDLDASISVGGQIYRNWLSVRVTRVYAASFSDFAFEGAEPGGDGRGWAALRIKPGERCQIILAGVKVIDGYVVDRQVGIDANTHAVLIQGRSLTREIARSTPQAKQYRGYTFEAIARAMAKEHGVKVIVKDPPKGWDKPIRNFIADPFLKTWGNLERLGRKRGVIMHDDKDGNLVLSGAPIAGGSVADLIEDDNILALRGIVSDNNVFSKIVAVGQDQGSDTSFGRKVAEVQAETKNPLGAPGSVLNVPGEHTMDGKDAENRANTQTGTYLGTDIDLTVTVHGWVRPDGQLWDVRDPISVRSPSMFPDGDGTARLGVRAVTFLQGPMGTVTQLNLVHPNALSMINPQVPKGEVPSIINSSGEAARYMPPDGADA
ncbi:phage baseplate assembly protein [Methylobacterium dankookense]|uniref:Uncharacterized protein n=1 Tax=Methylobacterium dankookense TaxID=560405 RepID=A0A564G7V8_9HYPH|nr:hypothetical protein [Methylobacterium dankookense]GJD59716.1 hypothetical protein IFDJLNFL_5647 [Methylobacterium dankookense]VUF16106.1 hypothetical protein MTDSW087_05857 [Methylobacterium dankookense]